VVLGENLTFRRNISPPFSGSKGKPSNKSAEVGGTLSQRHVKKPGRIQAIPSQRANGTIIFSKGTQREPIGRKKTVPDLGHAMQNFDTTEVL
jgi:hypothetical protein